MSAGWEYPAGEGRGRGVDHNRLLVETLDGRTVPVTAEPDETLGRVYYAVTGMGTFTIEAEDGLGWDKPERADEYRLMVHNGRHDTDGWRHGYQPLPEAPVVYGITLIGGSVCDPDDLPERSSAYRFPSAHRPTGPVTSTLAPEGTQRRLHAVLVPLVHAHMARPDRERLDAVRLARLAESRINGLHRDLFRALADRDKALAEMTRIHAAIAHQEVLATRR